MNNNTEQNTDQQKNIKIPKKKKKTSRCAFCPKNGTKCRKKLKLTAYSCRCGKKYCVIHRLPENHQCTINYKEINKDLYFSGLGGGTYQKLEVI